MLLLVFFSFLFRGDGLVSFHQEKTDDLLQVILEEGELSNGGAQKGGREEYYRHQCPPLCGPTHANHFVIITPYQVTKLLHEVVDHLKGAVPHSLDLPISTSRLWLQRFLLGAAALLDHHHHPFFTVCFSSIATLRSKSLSHQEHLPKDQETLSVKEHVGRVAGTGIVVWLAFRKIPQILR